MEIHDQAVVKWAQNGQKYIPVIDYLKEHSIEKRKKTVLMKLRKRWIILKDEGRGTVPGSKIRSTFMPAHFVTNYKLI